jgi:hypothetical protein
MICEPCRAAQALQTAHSDWLALASIDADLRQLIELWDGLPTAIRSTLLALIDW